MPSGGTVGHTAVRVFVISSGRLGRMGCVLAVTRPKDCGSGRDCEVAVGTIIC